MTAAAIEQSSALHRLRRVAVVAFGIQLVFILTWSVILWRHFSLTGDFAIYWQAWAKLNHGHLNPYDSIGHYAFVKDHGTVLMWPIALMTHFGLGGLAPLFAQDLAVFAAEVIAFAWVLRLLREHDRELPLRAWVIGAASLVFLIINPWTYSALSFDVHLDITLAAPFVVLMIRSLYYRQYGWLGVWTVLCLLCGDVAASYAVAIGLTGVIASVLPRQWLRLLASSALIVAGLAVFVLISRQQHGSGAANVVAHSLTSAPRGSLSTTGRISAVLFHPARLIAHVFDHRANLWAMISPAGPLGLFSVWAFPLAVVVAVSNASAGAAFTLFGFQYAALWCPLVAAGVLTAISVARFQWSRRVVGTVLILSVVNTAVWAAIWIPRLPGQWLHVSTSASQALARAEHVIPHDAEVIASSGIAGRFANRTFVYAFPNDGGSKPVLTPEVYFVLAPFQGIEPALPDQTLRLLGVLTGPMHAKLVLHGAGIWVVRWQPPKDVTFINLSGIAYTSTTPIPAWAAKSQIGHPVLVGPSHDWSMTTASQSGGYLVNGAYFNRPLGQYVLKVRLKSSGPVSVEAWDDTSQTLLGRRTIPTTDHPITVSVPVANTTAHPKPLFTGTFGFQTNPVRPAAGQLLEARVFTPAGTSASVYSVTLVRQS